MASQSTNLWVLLGLGLAEILIMMRKLKKAIREDFGAFIEKFQLLPPPPPPPPKAPHPFTGLTFAVSDVSGRVEEGIEMLQLKLKHIEEGIAFSGMITREEGSKNCRTGNFKVDVASFLFLLSYLLYIPRRLHDFDNLINNAEYMGTWPGLTCIKTIIVLPKNTTEIPKKDSRNPRARPIAIRGERTHSDPQRSEPDPQRSEERGPLRSSSLQPSHVYRAEDVIQSTTASHSSDRQ